MNKWIEKEEKTTEAWSKVKKKEIEESDCNIFTFIREIKERKKDGESDSDILHFFLKIKT